jgi:hypothetical protein
MQETVTKARSRLTVTKARSRLALAYRNHPDDAEAITEAQREFKTARLADRIETELSSPPELTDEQRLHLAVPLIDALGVPDEITCRRLLALLRSGGDGRGTAA